MLSTQEFDNLMVRVDKAFDRHLRRLVINVMRAETEDDHYKARVNLLNSLELVQR